ncbi:MAG: metallophosphoesterase family protein [Aestuariibacter sp.]
MISRIIQITDCHLYGDRSRVSYADINPFQSLQQVLKQAQQESPDKVVFTGDLSSDDSAASYQAFHYLVTEAFPETAISIIPGNHDDIQNMQQCLPAAWLKNDESERWRSFNIIYLNSQYRGKQGMISEAALEWLQHELRSIGTATLVFVHHHPMATQSFMDKHNWINADAFLSIVGNGVQPVYVLHGHIHHASERRHRNAHIWSAPSSCWQWTMTREFGVSNKPPGYRIIDLDSNGVSTSIKRLNQ